MDRRRFIRQVIHFSAGYCLSVPRFFLEEAKAAPLPVSDLVSVTGLDYRALVREAVNLLGSMQRFVKPGSRVVVKPNIGWDRSPEQGANTHPLVVRAIVELALEAGAKEVQYSTIPVTKSAGVTSTAVSPRLSIPCRHERQNSPTSMRENLSRWTLLPGAR